MSELRYPKLGLSLKGTLPAPIKVVAHSYSDLFFVHGLAVGCALLLLTFLNPHVAMSGLLSVVAAFAFAVFLGYRSAFLGSGFYTYNSLLVGLAIGHIFQLTWLTFLFIVIASCLTFLLTVVCSNVLSQYFGLPILSIPFVLVSSLVYLAARRFPNLYVTGLYSHPIYEDLHFLPASINGFFKALGAIIFMPHSIVGLVIALLLLWSSRILFALAIMGFVAGTVIQGLFMGSIDKAMTDVNAFNYILIAMAIGGVTLVPSLQSYILALLAVGMSTVMMSSAEVFWSQFGLPVFTLPFVVITLSFTYVLGLVQYKRRPLLHKKNPEQTLDHYLTCQDRYSPVPVLALPCQGVWTVWQGFDGGWTHQGIWKYAIDLVITDQEGKTHTGKGTHLEDYYCFQQPVLSAVQGRVIKVMNECPDNIIGAVDQTNNWGNMVLIHDIYGNHVEISHFVQGSITVKEGDYVWPGSPIGLCGNSGYSPQPHIHIQVQATADMGSATLPFRFQHYVSSKKFHAHGVPEQGELLHSAPVQPYYDQLTTFILDTLHSYEVYVDKKNVGHLDLMVHMAEDGTFFLQSSQAKLYFGKLNGRFVMYHMEGSDSLLRLFYLAMSSLPLSYEPGLSWTHNVSTTTLLTGYRRWSASLLNALIPELLKSVGEYCFISETEVSGQINNGFFNESHKTYLLLSPEGQVQTLIFDDIELRKVPHAKV